MNKYLNFVKKGEEVLITIKGKTVARITKEKQPTQSSIQERLEKMAAAGIIKLPKGRWPKMTAPLESIPGKPLSEMIIEDRR